MSPEIMQFVSPVVAALLGILNLWILWLAQEARKEMVSLEQRQTAADRDLANFRTEVAKEYVTTSTLSSWDEKLVRTEERLTSELRRLTDRIDKILVVRGQ